MIRLDPTQEMKGTQELLTEIPQRLPKYYSQFTLLVAIQMLDHVRAGLQRAKASSDYIQALEVSRLSGVAGLSPTYSVDLRPTARAVKNLPVKRTVLYIVPKARRQAPPPPEILILRNWGPWTPETIPFTPDKSVATIYERKVREDEAELIAKKNTDQARKVRKILAEYGIRYSEKQTGLKIDPQLSVIPDIAFEAMRLELGLGGAKKQATWGPAAQYMTAVGARRILASGPFVGALTSSRATTWRNWPNQVQRELSPAEIQQLRRFGETTAP